MEAKRSLFRRFSGIVLPVLIATALMIACGGGGSAPPPAAPPPTAVPDAAPAVDEPPPGSEIEAEPVEEMGEEPATAPEEEEPGRIPSHHSLPIEALAWSPDGTMLASGDSKGLVLIWDPGTLTTIGMYDRGDGIGDLTWLPGTSMLAVAGGKAFHSIEIDPIVLWDVRVDSVVHTYNVPEKISWIDDVSFSPDGRIIAGSGVPPIIYVFDVTTDETWYEFEAHEDQVTAVAWSYDGTWLATGDPDGRIILWNMDTGEMAYEISLEDGVQSIAWAPDTWHFAAGTDYNGEVRVYDTLTGEVVRTLPGLGTRVVIAWSPDISKLAAGTDDGRIIIFDTETWGVERVEFAHSDTITDLAWSPDSIFLASASEDQSVKVWDLRE
ncbi:MAG: WD40 repeat domain-containing protein [Anaerolineae bacterium]|nr:WD40 repeat domain-containing protein [Anaerolineae bacterium]